MENQEQTLNNVQGGASSTPQPESGDLVSTGADRPLTDDTNTDPGKAKNIQGKPDDSKAKEGDDKGSTDDKDKDLDRFDTHPRFKELIAEKNELRDTVTRLSAKLEDMESRTAGRDAEYEEEADYQDLTSMKKEDILEMQAEDPIAFAANLARQIRAEVKAEILDEVRAEQDERSTETRILSTYNKFAEDHEDFDELWDSGKIKAFMDKNPGHNAISAYYELTGDSAKQKEIEKAVKEKEKEILENVKAKKNLSNLLGGGPGGPPNVPPNQDLQDTKTQGGLNAALARKLAQRRAAGSAG